MGVRVSAAGAAGGLEEALEFLFARTTGGAKFGLERTQALLDALDSPQRAYPVLHVAGTNGKGSTLATAEALLRGRGLRVGKYTSPHLVEFRERVLVNGVPVGADFVVEFVDRWTPTVERLGATFFEATTALAFDAFARARVDVALIETGLGGRLDSTNVVEPVSAGVTCIGWDHMEYLGHTLNAIALEKAGIFKPGRPAVIGDQNTEIREVLRRRAIEVGAVPVLVEPGSVRDVNVSAHGTSATLTLFGEERRLQTPLTGAHQASNLAFALTLLHASGAPYAFSLSEAAPLLREVSLPGRFQRHGNYIFDVAHNADGARVLADTVRAVEPARPLVVLFCALRDKEWSEMIRTLASVADAFVLTNAPTAPASRAWNLDEVLDFTRRDGIRAEAVPGFEDALRVVDGGGTVLVTGSFHTVGDAMARLQVSPFAS